MARAEIKNVIFDVGNVLVRWSPSEIIASCFGNNPDNDELSRLIFHHEVWGELNRGLATEVEAKSTYRQTLGLSEKQIDLLFHHIRDSQELIDGTVELIIRLRLSNYRVFALTDNVKEIMNYLRERYDFWQYFEGVVVSADVQCTKPDSAIYLSLLTQHGLDAHETVFIDDHPPNVEGARRVELQALQFFDAAQCESKLLELGLSF